MDESVRSRAGRPRAVVDAAPQTSPRQQILLAAARLFVDQGISATSTRAIAEAVGIRQASLYYHFAGKDEILAELLEQSIRPSVEIARSVPGGLSPREAAVALHRLAAADAELLATTPHNVGILYLLPEVSDARFDEFRAERDELRRCYGRLARAAAGADPALDEVLLGHLVLQTVETAIQLRRSEHDPVPVDELATACLRIVGLDEQTIREIRAGAAAETA